MQRKTLNLVQGTDAWHQHRASHYGASEAPAMMGASKYRTRSELLREKATGLTAEVSEQQQRLYDRGHEAEALIRPQIEQQIGEQLYSTTMSAVIDGLPLSASLDGQNLMGDTLLECKLWNEGLAAQVRAGELEPHYIWQLEHQLLVSGAERVIFATGDGGERLETMEYRAVPGRAEQLIAGWRQFAKDVADYQHEPARAEVVAAPIAGFGALSLRVEGRVLASNLDAFKADAEAFITRLPKPAELQSDQDFADAEAAVKACGEAESRIKSAREAALAQMADVDSLLRTAESISETIRAARLALEKAVKVEKENRRLAIVTAGRTAYDQHVESLKAETKGVWLPIAAPDFAGAIKGKKSLSSMADAVDVALANGKIAANESAAHIRAALACLSEETAEHKHLFPDYLAFISKPVEDIRALVRGRIAEHKATEEAKAEQLREKIRKEEQEKLAAEQRARDAEAAKVELAEAQASPEGAELSPPAQALNEAQGAARFAERHPSAAPAKAAPPIKLGQINDWLAPLSISADGLASLGFHPAQSKGAAKLYAASDFPRICAALAKVVADAPARAAEKQAA